MNPLDVAASYDRLAARWDGDDFPRENGIAQHERALAFTTGPGPALDAGCGSSGRFIDLLLERGFTPEGVDLSAEMLARARRRHPDLAFHQADLCTWAPPRRYAFISGWDSVWHAPLAAQESVLGRLLDALAPGGVFIFTFGGTDEPGEITDAHMGPPMYHATLGVPRTLELIAAHGAICRHLEYDQHPELHTVAICQRLPEPPR